MKLRAPAPGGATADNLTPAPMQKKPRPKPPEPRLTKRLVQKPDGRYLILYEPAKPREGKS